MGPPRALTIAGSDSGGGAGIVTDLKTFTAHGCWAMVAVTAVTAQNTLGVQGYDVLPPEAVSAQIDSVASDIGVDAAKTGMLATAEVVGAVAESVRRHAIERLVVDPVFVSKHGDALLAPDAVAALRELLVPLALVVTPNLPEAAGLAGMSEVSDEAGMLRAAEAIAGLGAKAVLVKGGHLAGESTDVLWSQGDVVRLTGARIPGRHTHGTGCVLSAALAARLARGEALEEATRGAQRYVREAIAEGLPVGSGVGPVNPPREA